MSYEKPKLREMVLTFKMYWNALHCLRKFIMEYTGQPGYYSSRHQLAKQIGKIFERICASSDADEACEAFDDGLASIAPRQQEEAKARLLRLMRRAKELWELEQQDGQDRRHRVTYKCRQFYARLKNGWVLPAQPDWYIELRPDADSRPLHIWLADDKIGGTATVKSEAWLQHHAFVVSRSEQADAHESGLSGEAPAIDYRLRLMGMAWVGGNLVDAPQPETVSYDRRLEKSYLDSVHMIINKITRAFEKGIFPSEPSEAGCKDCPFQRGCRGYARFARQNGLKQPKPHQHYTQRFHKRNRNRNRTTKTTGSPGETTS